MAAGASLVAQATTTLTITDDEALPVISIAGADVTEGTTGAKLAQFPVTLIGVPTLQSVTVAYATASGSATLGADFQHTTGVLTFPPGTTSLTIDVPIIGDTVAEPDEAYSVTLSNPTNATLGVARATGIIQNDDVVVACTPRPRVTPTLSATGSTLEVRVEPTAFNNQKNNALVSVTFGTLQNATVTMNGQPIASGQTMTLPQNADKADFTVKRTTPGQPAMVYFSVVDNCGEWKTFVGGGAGAGF